MLGLVISFQVNHEEVELLISGIIIKLPEPFLVYVVNVVIPDDVVNCCVIIQFEQEEVLAIPADGLRDAYIVLGHTHDSPPTLAPAREVLVDFLKVLLGHVDYIVADQ